MQWKQKKIAESEASMDAQRAERAKNDRMRQVFFSEYLNPYLYSLDACSWNVLT